MDFYFKELIIIKASFLSQRKLICYSKTNYTKDDTDVWHTWLRPNYPSTLEINCQVWLCSWICFVWQLKAFFLNLFTRPQLIMLGSRDLVRREWESWISKEHTACCLIRPHWTQLLLKVSISSKTMIHKHYCFIMSMSREGYCWSDGVTVVQLRKWWRKLCRSREGVIICGRCVSLGF